MMSLLKSTLAGAAFLGASVAVASAAPALATADVNLRAGPGTQYQQLAVVPGGSTVNVLSCTPGWCEVDWQGNGGFISAGYLDGYDQPRVVRRPPVVIEQPAVIVAPPPVYYGPRPYYGRPYYGPRPYYRY